MCKYNCYTQLGEKPWIVYGLKYARILDSHSQYGCSTESLDKSLKLELENTHYPPLINFCEHTGEIK